MVVRAGAPAGGTHRPQLLPFHDPVADEYHATGHMVVAIGRSRPDFHADLVSPAVGPSVIGLYDDTRFAGEDRRSSCGGEVQGGVEMRVIAGPWERLPIGPVRRGEHCRFGVYDRWPERLGE